MQHTFGRALKDWRRLRRLSQLELAMDADVSARHISFLETGRAQPSRAMVIHLSEAMNIPRTARNTLLQNAGFAPLYQSQGLDLADLGQVSEAIDWMISRHDPYPALVFDQLWNVIRANKTGTATLAAFGIAIGGNMLDAMVERGNGREIFENWPEVASYLIHRLRAEIQHMAGCPKLENIVHALAQDPEIAAFVPASPVPAIIPARYKINGQVLSMFTTIAHFSTAEDIALAEMRIELMYPADDSTKQILLAQ